MEFVQTVVFQAQSNEHLLYLLRMIFSALERADLEYDVKEDQVILRLRTKEAVQKLMLAKLQAAPFVSRWS